MRVIICGAGQVGFSIASYLSRENNDVTVIDTDAQMVAAVSEQLDVNAIQGHASSPDVLSAAGANEADLIVAVTHIDEINMVSCQVAHSLFNVPKKIARIRDRRYLNPAWANLFSRAHMPIDVTISPEVEVAKALATRLSIPGTTNVIPLAGGSLYFCGVICESDCPVINTPLRQLVELFPDVQMKLLAISRDDKVIIPDADDQMKVGDEVSFVANAAHLPRILTAFGHDEQKARSIVIMGGGNIGSCLVDELQESGANLNIKIIEKDSSRALKLSESFEDLVILHGDGVDRQILEEADISHTEALVAVTDDDEANILGSLLARHYGCGRTITLVNRNTYSSLMAPLGLGAIVSPRAITVSTIMQHVRRGRIKAVHNVLDGEAEIIEAEASEGTDIVNVPLRDLLLPRQVLIGAILRDDTVIIPKGDTIIRPGDHVIIMATQGSSLKVEKMFSVQVNLF